MRTLIILLCLLVSLRTWAARELEWDDLVPADYDANAVYEQLFSKIYGDKPPEDVDDGDARGEHDLFGLCRQEAQGGKRVTSYGFGDPEGRVSPALELAREFRGLLGR